MVEYTLALDNIFGSLADPTRRDILRRVSHEELSVSDIAEPYDMSLAAVSKHLKLLHEARLIIKRRRGKQHLVHVSPSAFQDATQYLEYYQRLWSERLDNLEEYISKQEQ